MYACFSVFRFGVILITPNLNTEKHILFELTLITDDNVDNDVDNN